MRVLPEGPSPSGTRPRISRFSWTDPEVFEGPQSLGPRLCQDLRHLPRRAGEEGAGGQTGSLREVRVDLHPTPAVVPLLPF